MGGGIKMLPCAHGASPQPRSEAETGRARQGIPSELSCAVAVLRRHSRALALSEPKHGSNVLPRVSPTWLVRFSPIASPPRPDRPLLSSLDARVYGRLYLNRISHAVKAGICPPQKFRGWLF